MHPSNSLLQILKMLLRTNNDQVYGNQKAQNECESEDEFY